MVSVEVLLAIAWSVAIAGGIVSSLMGYATDPKKKFDKRKFGAAVATGIVAGLVFGITNASVNPIFKDPNATLFDITYQMGLVFVGAVGLDHLRNRVGDLATDRADKPQPNDVGG